MSARKSGVKLGRDPTQQALCSVPFWELMMRKIKTLIALGVSVACTFSTMSFAAGPAATIEDVAWLTGNYAGALGPNQLEENWIKAEGSSIAAMVRMTGNGGTSMFEMITIEEVDGSLVLHIQQFDPGFVPRSERAQKMELTAIGANNVHFKAASPGGMKTLGYTKDGDNFTIHVEQGDGPMSNLKLMSRSVWE
ncbi:MAG: DUF6265 family protein [Gammaproteobacteria bacterium]